MRGARLAIKLAIRLAIIHSQLRGRIWSQMGHNWVMTNRKKRLLKRVGPEKGDIGRFWLP